MMKYEICNINFTQRCDDSSGRADYPGMILSTEVPSHVDLAAGLNYKDAAV